MSLIEVRWKAEEFERNGWLWNMWGYIAAAAVVTLYSTIFAATSIPRIRIGSGLMIAGAMYMVWQLRGRALPGGVPHDGGLEDCTGYCRRQLERQRRFYRRALFWYFGSLVPAFILFLLRSGIYERYVMMYVFLLAEVIRRAAERLQREIDDLPAPN